MQILLSKEELEWIDKKPFNWSIKANCPNSIKKTLSPKLDTLNDFERREYEITTLSDIDKLYLV